MKEFSCPKCHCKRFWRQRVVELLVDFGREGAVEGHPFIEGPEREFTEGTFICAECGFVIRGETAHSMNAEIL